MREPLGDPGPTAPRPDAPLARQPRLLVRLPRLLVRQMPCVLWAVDTQLRVTTSLGAGLVALGLRPGELDGQSLADLYQGAPEVIAAHRRALGGEPVSYETTLMGRTFEAHVEPLRGVRGEINGCLGVALDITERQQAKRALGRSEAKLRRIVEAEMFGIISWDAAGGITEANDAFLRMLGYTAHDLATGRVRWRDLTPPEYLPLDEAALDELASCGRMAPFEKEYIHRDGHRVPVLVGGALFEGEREHGVAFVLNLTALKESQRALAASEERYRRIVETAHEGVWVIDAESRTTFVNRRLAEILGYAPDELLGRSALDFMNPEDRTAALRDLAQRQQGVAERRDYRFRRKDGSEVLAVLSMSPFTDTRGQYTGALALVSDVTEHRRLEEQYRQAQKMEAVGRLAGGVAHDFNNLLTVIGGYSELLLTSLPEGDPRRDAVLEVRRAGERAAALTRQLLLFSRRQIAEPHVLDLNAVVHDMEKLLCRALGEDVRLQLQLDPSLGPLRADAGQLEQVLMNLAVNARDAMPQGGELTIQTRTADLTGARARPGLAPGRYAVLVVADTGTGMDHATRARLFEPFFTTKEPGKGTGLGLAIVYGVVQQARGHIEVESAPGHGATFRIYLPMVDEPLPSPLPTSEDDALPGGCETVLLVEDEEAVRALTVRLLRDRGYRVLESAGAREALRLAHACKEPIHLLLTDVVMPYVGGRQLARSLKVLHPEARVLYMTGYTDDAALRHGVQAEETELLQKPFTPGTLARKVRAVLDAKR